MKTTILQSERFGAVYMVLGAIVLYVLTAPVLGYSFSGGLDSSGGFGLNYFFAHHIQLGRDVLYSYGPFGFLNGPLSVGNNLLYSIVLQSVLKTGFIYLLLCLFSLKRGPAWQIVLGVIATAFLSLFTDFTLMLIFSVPLALIMGRESKKQGWYLAACVLAAFGLCYKSVTGVTTFAALFMFFLSEYALKKNWRLPIQYMLLTIGATLLFWFSAYGNLEGLLGYILSLPEFAQGQASAMTQNPENNWFALSIMFLGFLSLPALFRSGAKSDENQQSSNSAIVSFWVMMITPTYMFWKYAYTRQDHSIFFLMYAVMFYVILLGFTRRFDWKMLAAIAMTFLGMYANMKYSGYDHVKLTQMKIQAQGILHVADVLDYPRFEKQLKEQSDKALEDHRLSPNMLKRLQQGTVDFYPWETTYAAANPTLRWSPRPVFQSHMTFRPYFDKKNADFLSGATGPMFILWEKDHRGGKMGSIDYRYLLNDDPLTIQAILTHFKPVMEDSRVVVFERQPSGMFKAPVSLTETGTEWGQWISVSDIVQKNASTKPFLLRANVKAMPTLLAKIKRSLYKENDAWIEYRLADGTVKKHRLVLDNMISGLAASPYVTEMTIPWKTIPVQAIRLTHSKSDPYDPKIHIQWILFK